MNNRGGQTMKIRAEGTTLKQRIASAAIQFHGLSCSVEEFMEAAKIHKSVEATAKALKVKS
jgi:hypothetical protein